MREDVAIGVGDHRHHAKGLPGWLGDEAYPTLMQPLTVVEDAGDVKSDSGVATHQGPRFRMNGGMHAKMGFSIEKLGAEGTLFVDRQLEVLVVELLGAFYVIDEDCNGVKRWGMAAKSSGLDVAGVRLSQRPSSFAASARAPGGPGGYLQSAGRIPPGSSHRTVQPGHRPGSSRGRNSGIIESSAKRWFQGQTSLQISQPNPHPGNRPERRRDRPFLFDREVGDTAGRVEDSRLEKAPVGQASRQRVQLPQ